MAAASQASGLEQPWAEMAMKEAEGPQKPNSALLPDCPLSRVMVLNLWVGSPLRWGGK